MTYNREGLNMRCLMMLALLPVSLLGACVMVPPTSAELESCQRMEREMGVGQIHDHSEMKGLGLNPMNLSHARCRRILEQ